MELELEIVGKTLLYGFIMVLIFIIISLVLQAAGLPLDTPFTVAGRQNPYGLAGWILGYCVFLSFIMGALGRWLYDQLGLD